MRHHYIKVSMDEKDIMTLNAYRVCNDRFPLDGTESLEESDRSKQLEKEAVDIVRESFWSVIYACKKETEDRLMEAYVDDFLEERANSEKNKEGGS